ncbi:hypothetical protein J8M97_04985 [Gordonia polyisoprenivorans]|uniref:hypothetical protein n=1 Tax=Gordonia polyisoprenivorans TaxID=84595 RepID=UPI001B8C0B0B|nr:hypothetical protein [Gordonia polyisoprenivorans]QUD83999.1 hypothetical protein J8M97_04985 [Gordonia polyisoprenivorans]
MVIESGYLNFDTGVNIAFWHNGIELVHVAGCAECAADERGSRTFSSAIVPHGTCWSRFARWNAAYAYFRGCGVAVGDVDWCAVVDEQPALFVATASAEALVAPLQRHAASWSRLRAVYADGGPLPEVSMNVYSDGDGRPVLVPGHVVDGPDLYRPNDIPDRPDPNEQLP